MPDRRIYLLSPRALSPETIAVAFARTSRSPESFEEIAAGLTDEKSAQFHEKWVVGYGHASVAEHAVLHVALENVSRLAIESIESNRLASFTEKSTRYQKWNLDDFLVPPELEAHPLRGLFVETCRLLFKTYHESLEPVRKIVVARAEPRENESEEALDRRLRSQYVDACRFLLPAASLANVGVTANARVLEHMLRKMLSHPLSEVRLIGEQVKAAARAEVPTLVKYADAVDYLRGMPGAFGLEAVPERASDAWCSLVQYDEQAEDRILAAALYRFGGASYAAALAHVAALGAPGRRRLAKQLLGGLGEHDIPLRELEYVDYTFDLLMDQGAYAEFKRHRMMTQTPQLLTARLGFVTPRLIEAAGIESAYRAAMQAAATAYARLAEFDPQLAQYVVPNGYNRRVLARFNLREAWHFCALRGAPNAHFSIRRVAHRIAAEIRRVHPLLTEFMPRPDETWQAVEDRHLVK
jgi:thymidylate synthase ThyX